MTLKTSDRLPDYLDHMRQAIADAQAFTEGMTPADFMQTSFTPTFAHVPPGPLAGPLQLLPVNAAVVSVHTADGAHVGSLKLVGGVWKFKAMGYDVAGRMEPGHGPLTDQHNMAFAAPDAAEVSARLLGALAGESGAGS